MATWDEAKDVIFKIGSLAGLSSFLWLLIKDIIAFFEKPRLRLSFDRKRDLRQFQYSDTRWVRKVATLHVQNRRNQTAKRCVATLQIINKTKQTEHLEDKYALHWAGVDYSSLTTGAQPIDLGPELVRLDVAFTQQGMNAGGCWIAVPFTLSGNLNNNQAYLPPGEYNVEIAVSCENGKGDEAEFKIISPAAWDSLDMIQL